MPASTEDARADAGVPTDHSTSRPSTPGADSGRLPLHGIRVLELSEGLCEATGRVLADLGAEVIKVEPETGSPSRQGGITEGGVSLTFAANNANKLSVVASADRPDGQDRLLRLVRTADLVLYGGPGAQELSAPVDPAHLMTENPSLVLMRLSYFGESGPYKDWAGSSDVVAALSGLLAQSGLPDHEPLLPPDHLVDAVASAQAAWTAMLALWKANKTGAGEVVDFSVLEGVSVSLDPGYGISGSARGAADDLPWGRPDARHLYPIFPCADGSARICLLSGRQWANMLEWMGNPAELSDPKYAVLRERQAATGVINPVLARFFAGRTRAQIVEEGRHFRVPASGLVHPSELLTTPHFVARDTFAEVPIGTGQVAKIPRGVFRVDGTELGLRAVAPALGEQAERIADGTRYQLPLPSEGSTGGPFAGLRVLDLGVIVAGAEAGRLFADWGADVIKVENLQYPDGNRQSAGPNTVTPSFARGHRNKRSLGLNLRSERGREIFLDLVRQSDIVLSNFKPGTLESLDLGPDTLLGANPRLILADSNAFGSFGPWSSRMGYGPLVRASTGLTWLWSYPDEENSFSDAITIYPDHVVSRFVAIAVVALLMRRGRTGTGGVASIAQIDVLLYQMADRVMAESMRPGSLRVVGNHRDGDAPRGVYACAGADEWCVVDIQNDEQFRGLAHAIGRTEWTSDPDLASAAGRLEQRSMLEAAVRAWTRQHPPREAMATLQQHGVPCGFMQRSRQFSEDPQYVARGFLHHQDQPQFDGQLVAQNGEAVFSSMGIPPFGAAPVQGEHTTQVCTDLLGMSESDVDDLVEAGVLERPPADVLLALSSYRAQREPARP